MSWLAICEKDSVIIFLLYTLTWLGELLIQRKIYIVSSGFALSAIHSLVEYLPILIGKIPNFQTRFSKFSFAKTRLLRKL